MEDTIKGLLNKDNRIFKIPSYQKSFSWEKEPILQFIEDIKDAKDNYYLLHFKFESKL